MLRTKIWYALLLIFFWFFSILYNEYATFTIFLIMVLIPLLLWIVFMISKRYVDVRMTSNEYVYTRRNPFDITLSVSNRCFIPIPKMKIYVEYDNYFTREKKVEVVITSIEAKSEMSLTIASSSQFCGICCYRISKVIMYDYLALFTFRNRNKQQIEIAILPTFHLLEDRLAKENASVLVESDLFSSTKSGDDPSEIHNIRSYVEGDRMNHIHWKLSLKNDELMVKEFGLPINCSVAIMADFYSKEIPITLPKLDAIIEVLLSLSISMVYQEQIHYMIWYDDLRETCHRSRIEKEEDCYESIAMLYHCKLRETTHSLATFHEAQFSKEQYTNIFYITAFLDEELLTSLNSQRKSAVTQLYVVQDVEEEFEEYKNEAVGMGMRAYGLSIPNIDESILSLES